ncbi:MAG: DUF3667 domain-containing protein [Opitutaceae bacterium]|nr:DUF3667 domain-containing protein [Opitutaceae bacterium]
MPDTPEPADIPAPEPPSLSGALATDAAGAQGTEPPAHHHDGHENCQNCGTPLQGPFCHHCGQHDFDINRSFGHTFLEALENFFHFDAKLFRNVVTLLFRPGRLTVEFNAGKRASQMPPFRLYVFVSFLFFFLAFLNEDTSKRMVKTTARPEGQAALLVDGKPISLSEAIAAAGGDMAEGSEEKRMVDQLREAAETIQRDRVRRLDADATTPAEGSDGKAGPAPDTGHFREKLGRLLDPEGRQHVLHAFIVAIPKILLICLPLYALYTRLLFRKSGRLYLQHLVLSLHYHTFFYLWFMVRDGWVFLTGFVSTGAADWLQLASNLWLLIYPIFMLRHMFGNSWPRTIFKGIALSMFYVTTIGLAFMATAAFIIFVL